MYSRFTNAEKYLFLCFTLLQSFSINTEKIDLTVKSELNVASVQPDIMYLEVHIKNKER